MKDHSFFQPFELSQTRPFSPIIRVTPYPPDRKDKIPRYLWLKVVNPFRQDLRPRLEHKRTRRSTKNSQVVVLVVGGVEGGDCPWRDSTTEARILFLLGNFKLYFGWYRREAITSPVEDVRDRVRKRDWWGEGLWGRLVKSFFPSLLLGKIFWNFLMNDFYHHSVRQRKGPVITVFIIFGVSYCFLFYLISKFMFPSTEIII